MLLQPILLALVLVPVVFAARSSRATHDPRDLTVAVDDGAARVEGVVERLGAAGLRTRVTSDATLAVVGDDADVGVVLGSPARRDDPIRLVVERRSENENSTRASGIALRALEEFRVQRSEDAFTAAGAQPDAAAPIRIEVSDVSRASPQAARLTLAAALPTLAAIQLFGLVSLAQQRIGSAKDRRVLEPLLVLPLSRTTLLAGAALAALTAGLAGSLILLGPLGIALVSGIGRLTGSLAAPASVLASLALEVAALAALFSTAGVFVGARSASGVSSNTVASAVQIALILVLSASVFVAEADVTPALAATPVVGALLTAREGVADGLVASHAAITAAVHGGLAALFLGAGARRLGDERSVLRVSR